MYEVELQALKDKFSQLTLTRIGLITADLNTRLLVHRDELSKQINTELALFLAKIQPAPVPPPDYELVLGPQDNLIDRINTAATATNRPATIRVGLKDGTYNQSLILAALSNVKVKAINDGAVLFDGEYKRNPVAIRGSKACAIEGVNACRSSGTVVLVDNGSADSVIRRVCAWDAAEGNRTVYGITNAQNTLLEDIAGWGNARKIFESSWSGNYTTVRRMWGRWEGCHSIGPKMVLTLVYNNYNMIVEDFIGTWSGQGMKQSYTLMGNDGKTPWVGTGMGTYNDYRVDQPYGILAADSFTGAYSRIANSRISRAFLYTQPTDRVAFGGDFGALFLTKVDGVSLEDITVRVHGTDKRSLALHPLPLDLGGPAKMNFLSRYDIGAGQKFVHPTWKITEGTPNTAWLNNWPMNQRIKEGLVQSGRAPVDVQQTVRALL